MVVTATVSVKFRPLKKKTDFFEYGRPLVDPKRARLYLSRRFDLLLLLGLVVSLMALIVHAFLITTSLPEETVATENVTSHCAIVQGEWNKKRTVLRFWSVPYAAPPQIRDDLNYEEVRLDLAEKYGFQAGGLRWHKPYSMNDTEYCFLSFDDRCSYEDSQWFCKMRRPNRTANCVELNNEGKLFSEQTENCLTLDIASPAFSGDLFPVVVVMAGFRSLFSPMTSIVSREQAYLPTDSVVLHSGAIWVRVRYRLGPLGSFYNFAQLDSPRNPTVDFVNFALHDQRAALQWVKQNIGRYGGDARRVVLLAHGSGATSALQLIRLQAQQRTSDPWFQAAWLASGATTWYHHDNRAWQQLQAYSVLRKLSPSCSSNDVLRLDPSGKCQDGLRSKYTDAKLVSLVNHFREAYLPATWGPALLNPVRFEEQNVSVHYAVDKEFSEGHPPVYWSEDTIKDLFYESREHGRPLLKALVFSSMESEFEGFPDSSQPRRKYLSSLEKLLKIVTNGTENATDLFGYLKQVEEQRASKPGAWPTLRAEWDVFLNTMSALRVTCPQAWLLSLWLFNRTDVKGHRTRFYHLQQNESPRIPFTDVPVSLNSSDRRYSFNGLDMLLLTGNYPNLPSKFDRYRQRLWHSFKQFVHHHSIERACELSSTDKPVAHMGCWLNANGATRVPANSSTDRLCALIDWETHFHSLAMVE